jgi:hypothetical protein
MESLISFKIKSVIKTWHGFSYQVLSIKNEYLVIKLSRDYKNNLSLYFIFFKNIEKKDLQVCVGGRANFHYYTWEIDDSCEPEDDEYYNQSFSNRISEKKFKKMLKSYGIIHKN